MELYEELNNLSKRIRKYIDNNQVKGEQATINFLIKPFLHVLGFDDTNPAEVVPEFTADIGIKKDEKVDLAIFKEGKVLMLIECKDCNSGLSQKDLTQLFRYFTVTDARIGILTNGVLYKLFTDLDKPNLMDTKPFFQFNMTEISPSVANVLYFLTKDNFNLNKILSTAIDLKHRIDIKDILRKQLDTPTNDFVEFFHKTVKSQVEKQAFTDIVKRAFNEFLGETYNELSNGNEVEEQPNESDEDREQIGVNDEKPKTSKDRQIVLTNIKVTMPDGSVIYHHNGNETYLDALEKLGLEEVMRVRPNIVSIEQFSHAIKGVKRGKYWVRGGQKFSTGAKIRELKKIADLLNISIKVEQLEKKT
ncbi:type I restriction enzyme HsdR N-terminal domain-containing protein [Candidatus Poribacteria bacterium]|nr:type I restriction enzyme HsdR N-terminal domain-containing protein [Candidatus Poribacteria bacterium]